MNSDPRQAIIFSLLRTAKSENEFSQFMTLDIQHCTTAKRLASLIIYLSTASTREEELVELNNIIHIPRLEMDDKRNSKLPHGFGRVSNTGLFHQDATLKMQGDTFDSKTALVFQQVDRARMADDEVELQVEGAGTTSPGLQGMRDHLSHETFIISDFRQSCGCGRHCHPQGKFGA